MEIIIGRPIEQPKYENVYKIVIDFMYGDADGSGQTELFIDKDNKELPRFIKFLNDCEKVPGLAGWDSIKNYVPDFKIFASDINRPEHNEDLEDIYVEWHSDPTNDGGEARFDGYRITFFNEEGIEHRVTIKP